MMATDEEIGNLVCDIRALMYPMGEDGLKYACEALQLPMDPKKSGRLYLLQALDKYITVIIQDEEPMRLLNGCLAILKTQMSTFSTGNTTNRIETVQQPRKELKFSGTINGADGVSFVNLVRQIEVAREKQHSEKEIVWAVVRAIHPSQQLRGYLEGKTDLTLPVLRKLLRAYFRERSASELYSELTDGCQGPREEVLDFVWRILDLGQKVCFASEEEGSGLNYDRTLVRQMTLRSIQTGLREEAIALDIKEALMNNPSDEELTSKINTVVAGG